MSRQSWNVKLAFLVLAAAALLVLPQRTVAQQLSPAGAKNGAAENASVKPDDDTGKPANSEPDVPAEVVVDLTNARFTMISFLDAVAVGDYAKAARAIDFASMDDPPEQTMRENLAFKLADVIKSLPEIDKDKISDDPEGAPVLLPPGDAEQPIEIAQGDDGQWRFTANMVGQIEALYDQYTAKTTQEIAEEVGVAEADSDDPTAVEDRAAEVADELDNARETMQTFLTAANAGDYALATHTMDFSLLPAPTEGQKSNLAWKLKEVIDRMQWVDFAKVPSSPDAGPFLFPIGMERQPIEIAKGPDSKWRFTREAVARIDGLYDQLKDKPKLTESRFPLWMRTPLVAGNEGWRILLLFVAIFTSLFVAWLVQLVMHRLAMALEKRQPIVASFFDSLGKSLVPFLLWLGVWISFQWLVLDDIVLEIVDSILSVLLVLAVAYVLYRLVDVVDAWIHAFADKTESKLDDMLAPLLRRSFRTTIVILALVQIASILSEKPPASIIAGLGVASIAIGLAAQDTIKNVFGSIMLLTDRPFEVGDRVVVGGHDGPVESIGFRSTRIRTLEGHLVTVPNGELANTIIQNIGKRPRIRRSMNVTITYDTPAEKIERAVQIIKDILDNHEGMHSDFPPRVFFNEFNDTSLNISVTYWYHPPDYYAFAALNERVNLAIFRRYEAERIEFAFPTQTLYLAGDPNRPLNIGTGGNDSPSNSSGGGAVRDSHALPGHQGGDGLRKLDRGSAPTVESDGTDVDAEED
jgi:MscS family membrane protein